MPRLRTSYLAFCHNEYHSWCDHAQNSDISVDSSFFGIVASKTHNWTFLPLKPPLAAHGSSKGQYFQESTAIASTWPFLSSQNRQNRTAGQISRPGNKHTGIQRFWPLCSYTTHFRDTQYFSANFWQFFSLPRHHIFSNPKSYRDFRQ